MLHGVGRRGAPGGVRHARPTRGGPRRDHPRGARPRGARRRGPRPSRRSGPASAASARPGSSCDWPPSERAATHPDDDAVERALLAHLCRCTGWRTILEAARHVYGVPTTSGAVRRRPAPGARPGRRRRAERRSRGASPRRSGPSVACGGGGFAEDTAPADALRGGARRSRWLGGGAVARRGPGRAPSGSRAATPPWRCATPWRSPPAHWDLTLRTTFVEPAYLEPDASWCVPGGEPVTPLANGGAFGGKLASPVGAVARRLADETGRPVRVVLLTRGRRALRTQAPPDRGGCPARRFGRGARGPHPGLTRSRPVGARGVVGGARAWSWRRSPWPGRRSRPTCGPRAGPRPPSSWPRSSGARRRRRPGHRTDPR